MKSQKWGLLVIAVLAVSLLSFYVCGSPERQPNPDQTQVQALLDLMRDIPSVPDAAKESLARQIASDFDNMKALFRNKQFVPLAKLLGKRAASLATPGFEKIHGAASAEHWNKVWNTDAELDFVPVHVYAKSVEKPQPVPYSDVSDEGITYEDWQNHPTYYDAVAVVVFEYHIVTKGQGKASDSSADPPAAEIYFHKTGCPWG